MKILDYLFGNDDFVIPEGYSIRENNYGKFQVWKGDQVLRPCNLELLSDYQSGHYFMFVGSMRAAKKLIKRRRKLEYGSEIKKVYKSPIERI